MDSQTIKVGKKRQFKITLTDDNTLGEVVVVGYGQQKKASVVGFIAQTDSKTLNRHAGVSSLGQALTGNLPGVVTFSSKVCRVKEDPEDRDPYPDFYQRFQRPSRSRGWCGACHEHR